MKYFFVFILFFSTFLSAQTTKKTDSIPYYSNLADYNIQINKPEKAILYTQKAIVFCEKSNDIEEQTNQTFKLGKIYFNENEYEKAAKAFHKSLFLYKKLPPYYTIASVYYYLGLTNIEKEKYSLAAIYFDKSEAIFNSLKIKDT